MDPKPPSGEMWLAPPPSGSSAALRLPGAQDPPSVDDHLVKPETREQLVRGRRVVAMPALPPHGDRHFELDYVIRAHVKEGYIGSSDLLTRVSHGSDFATDTCVRRAGIDPKTGARYLEELAFEIVNEQSMRDVTEQAEDLTARGVRRVIAIFVKKGDVCEWSTATGSWKKLDLDSTFADPTLARPLRVRELLDAAEADNAVARALITKDNPVIAELTDRTRKQGRQEGREAGLQEGRDAGLQEGREAGRQEGHRQGLVRGVELACELLGIELTQDRRAHMNNLDARQLEALIEHLRTARRWP